MTKTMDDPAQTSPSKLTVALLKEELEQGHVDYPKKALKAELVELVTEHRAAAAEEQTAAKQSHGNSELTGAGAADSTSLKASEPDAELPVNQVAVEPPADSQQIAEPAAPSADDTDNVMTPSDVQPAAQATNNAATAEHISDEESADDDSARKGSSESESDSDGDQSMSDDSVAHNGTSKETTEPPAYNDDYRSLKFYNYTPRDKELRAQHVNVIDTDADDKWVQEQLQPLLDSAKGDAIDPLQYLAPRHLNADIKRDMKRKFDVLNQRTRQAIAKLVKQKLAEEGDNG